MKLNKKLSRFLLVGILAGTIIGCQTDANLNEDDLIEVENITFKNTQVIPNQYTVRLKSNGKNVKKFPKVKSLGEYQTQMNDLQKEITRDFKSVVTPEAIQKTYGHVFVGFTANLTKDQLEALRRNPNVESIEQDFMFTISPYAGKPGGNTGGSDPQVIPYGTTRVGGGSGASSNTAWVIDSGIDLDHEDLNVDVARSASFLTGSPSNLSPEDQNGHGTHVAGTIAAIDNSVGTVGVAPGNVVVAVRVLDRRGSGSNSGVIAGVDYVAANGSSGDVANMSLGGGISTALDNAVISAASTGVKFVLAAGNSATDANSSSPARANGTNVYTISAMDINDNFASFSNYGSPVDYCAPGVAVRSTWKSGGYNTISGTSMAAPHAAGVLLFGNPTTDGTVNGDPDGNPDAIIHL
ncbi:S8 family peptidase [Kordia sp. YSTF-M3]|uniref:S8 family peptidase n=1 Tax=Kordia aestuariivivens TaxID=2759037 RepID=A0ABR7Q500_9FLAO|nr:S8 family peptidase [Kordia aestuariivivens]MBC8753646.1 S8 family peptidase [Kordia aestuariivivens]